MVLGGGGTRSSPCLKIDYHSSALTGFRAVVRVSPLPRKSTLISPWGGQSMDRFPVCVAHSLTPTLIGRVFLKNYARFASDNHSAIPNPAQTFLTVAAEYAIIE